jgi:hypothetical protein
VSLKVRDNVLTLNVLYSLRTTLISYIIENYFVTDYFNFAMLELYQLSFYSLRLRVYWRIRIIVVRITADVLRIRIIVARITANLLRIRMIVVWITADVLRIWVLSGSWRTCCGSG